MINTTKLLLYKESLELTEKINFDDDKYFFELLIFAYFNSTKNSSLPKEILEEILQGYYLKKKELK